MFQLRVYDHPYAAEILKSYDNLAYVNKDLHQFHPLSVDFYCADKFIRFQINFIPCQIDFDCETQITLSWYEK